MTAVAGGHSIAEVKTWWWSEFVDWNAAWLKLHPRPRKEGQDA